MEARRKGGLSAGMEAHNQWMTIYNATSPAEIAEAFGDKTVH